MQYFILPIKIIDMELVKGKSSIKNKTTVSTYDISVEAMESVFKSYLKKKREECQEFKNKWLLENYIFFIYNTKGKQENFYTMYYKISL